MNARRFLNNFFSCHSKIDILRTIINSEEPQSGRQIASRAGLSPRSCQLSLDELVKLNVLDRKASGKAYYYSVNIDNQIVTDLLIPIIQQEERLTRNVVKALRFFSPNGKKSIKGIYFLESWPKGWGRKGYGALLMAVLGNNTVPSGLEKKLQDSCKYTLDKYGMPSDYIILNAEQFSNLVLKKQKDLARIEDRAQTISGIQISDLLREERGHAQHLKMAVDFFPKKGKKATRRKG